MMNLQSTADYERVARAIHVLSDRNASQPRLDELARHLRMSPFHLQRMFQRWAGISPKRFVQAVALERAKAALKGNHPVLDAAFEAGLSGPGRLHDLFVTLEAMTPGEYRRRGHGVTISYGFHESPFGLALVAATGRGICGLAFCCESTREDTLVDLRSNWPEATWIADFPVTAKLASLVFGAVEAGNPRPLAVVVRGTNFQVKVWNALLQIPLGGVTTYADVAAVVGRPHAVRAAASAIGDNPVAWLIPCHRVIRKTGELGGYRWGLSCKSRMLAWEGAQRSCLQGRKMFVAG